MTFDISANTVGAEYFVGDTETSYTDYSISAVEGYSIQKIYCSDLDNVIPGPNDVISNLDDFTITFSPDVY